MKANNIVQTARASHSRCLICNRQNISLFVVKSDCMRYAYENNRILIKKQSRVCSRHLDKNGKIKLDHFSIIPSRPEIHDSTLVTLLDSFASFTNNCNIFDQFRNCDFLEEQIFIQITGWTKQQFIIFSRYVTSIRDTNGRTKERSQHQHLQLERGHVHSSPLRLLGHKGIRRQVNINWESNHQGRNSLRSKLHNLNLWLAFFYENLSS